MAKSTVSALGVNHGNALLSPWEDPSGPWPCLVDGGETSADSQAALGARGFVMRYRLLDLGVRDE